MLKITLEEARRLYASTGDCKHLFLEDVEPLGCGIRILNCIVCTKEFSRVYLQVN